jgi:hypothetical protein
MRTTRIGRTPACLLLVWLAASPVFGQAPAVAKVEPPNWWPGHSINPVRVLVRGAHLGGATVDAVGAGLSIGLTRTNAAGTCLFVDVLIDPAAAPGARTLRVRTASGIADARFEISAPLTREGRFRGITPDDVLLFGGGIIPDDDVPALKAAGFKAIFGPGTSTQDIVEYVRANVGERV